MKYLVIILLVISCQPPHQVQPIKKDTTTGHWEYDHDEEMKWVPNSCPIDTVKH